MKTITYTTALVVCFSQCIGVAFGQPQEKKITNADTTAKSAQAAIANPDTGKKASSVTPPKPAQKTDTSNAIAPYKGKSFVFDQNTRIQESDGGGAKITLNPLTPLALQ